MLASTTGFSVGGGRFWYGEDEGTDNGPADWDAVTGPTRILNKPTIPAAHVQSDWNVTDSTSDAFILNKPIVTNAAIQVQSNWTTTDTTSLAYIVNKPTIPAAQQQSDWNVTDTTLATYILNKPALLQGATGATGATGSAGSDGDSTVATAAATAAAGAAAVAAGSAASAAAEAAAAAASAAAAAAAAEEAAAAEAAGEGGDDLADGESASFCDWLAPLSSNYHVQHIPNIISGCTQGGRVPTVVSVPAVPNVSAATYTVICPGTCTTLTDYLYCPATTSSGGTSGLRLGWDQSYSTRDSSAGQLFMADTLRMIGQGFATTAAVVPYPLTAGTSPLGYNMTLQDNVTIVRSLLCPTIQATVNMYTKLMTVNGLLYVGDPTLTGRDPNAGTIGYATTSLGLDITGAGTTVGERLVNILDNMQVNGDLTVTGNLVVKGNATISGVSAGAGWCTMTGGFINQFGSFTYKPVYNSSITEQYIYLTWPKLLKTGVFSLTLTPGDTGVSGDSPQPALAVYSTSLTGATVAFRAMSGTTYSGYVTGYYQCIGL